MSTDTSSSCTSAECMIEHIRAYKSLQPLQALLLYGRNSHKRQTFALHA